MIKQVEQIETKPTAQRPTLKIAPVGKIVVVDDEPELKNILVASLSAQGFEVTGCNSAQQALAELQQGDFDLLLTDLMMPEMDGIALLAEALRVDPNLVGIMMTGQGTVQTAVDAMKLGAFDYVLKPFRLQTLMPVLTRAINTRRLRMENLQLRETVAIYGLCQTIAFTLDPQTVLSRLADAALQQSDADEVSILLPIGDGKELYVAAVRGAKRERLLGQRVPLHESISSWVARERTPVLLNGEVHDERFVARWPRPEIRSAVSIPMQVANKLVGVINLNVTSRLRPFTLGQMKALTILASTAAAALESASLHTQVERAEKDYRSIFENAVEGIFQSTLTGRFITVNPSLAHILGYASPGEVIAHFAESRQQQLYVDPAFPSRVSRALQECGVIKALEFEAYRKGGEKIWLSLNVRVIHDDQGREVSREGTIEDITERKRSEDERLVIFEIIQGVITTRNLDELLRLIHKSIGKLLYAENCFVGLFNSLTNLMSFEYWSDQFDPVPFPHPPGKGFSSYVLRTNRPLLLTEELRTQMFASGEAEPKGRSSASWLGVPLRIGSRAIGVLVVQHYEDKNAYSQRDLELLSSVGDQIALAIERKRAEEALKETARSRAESLALIDTILATAPIGFAFHSPDLVYQRINESLAVINGLPVAQHLGRTLHDVLPEMSVVLEPLLQQVIDTGEPILDLEVAGQTPADLSQQHHWLVSFYPVRLQEGELLGVGVLVSEITERKRVEEAFKQSESRLAEAQRQAHIGSWNLDLRNHVLTWSDEHYRIFGLEPGDLGQNYEEVFAQSIHVDDRELLEIAVAKTTETKEPFNIYFRIIRRDGELRTIHSTGSIETDESGQPIRMLGTAQDVTERMRIEEEQRKTRQQYELLVQSIDGIVWELDVRSFRFTFISNQCERLLGYPPDQWLADPEFWRDHLHPDDRSWAIEFCREAMARGENHEFDYRMVAADGRVVWLRDSVTVDRTEPEQRHLRGVMVDITERKLAENELKESEARYRDLVENAQDLIYEHDLNGNFTATNKAVELITGYSFEESLSLNLRDLVAPDYLEKAQEMIRRKLAGDIGTAYDLIIIARDGRRVPVEVTTRLVLKDGVPVGIQGIARDITKRKILEAALLASEEQLRQSQKLEAIGQLAGGVAHDFNNLLTVIGGYSSILLGKLAKDSPHRTAIEEIKKASDRASALTRQLLAFSRKQILQPKILDLNVVVTDLERMVRRLIGEDIDLLTITSPTLGKVKADPGQIEQVLLNLIVNARDAMPHGGKLTIETLNVRLSEEYAHQHAALAGPHVMLAVSDTGCGMDAAIQARIFEPFFTTKEPGRGTGLGLATAYGIVKQSGGNVWVYSEVARGSTFKIYLPQVVTVEEEEALAAREVPRGTELVLLVEDEDQVRGILKQILEGQGYHVIAASNGEEALSISQDLTRDIKLMVTDVVMPQMSGRELAERISAHRPGLPVLFMSGYTDDAIVRHGLLDEQLNFIQKPFDFATVGRKVREVLDSDL